MEASRQCERAALPDYQAVRDRAEKLEVENSAVRMRLTVVSKHLENLTAAYNEMVESRQEALSQAELLNRELLNLSNENKLLQEQIAVNPDATGLTEIRDRTLGKLKMGRQSAAGKAIDAFIKELAKLPMPNTKTPKPPIHF